LEGIEPYLKAVLAFTFHHSEDAPWIDVLESLFNAGFYLEATIPIRGDETKRKAKANLARSRSNTTSSTSAVSA
jgi:hypothetical protein